MGSASAVPGLRRAVELADDERNTVLVLEDVEGRPLSEALVEGPLPLSRALAAGAAIARTLAQLHALGSAHGDVCPSKIILDGRDGRSWLIGLGRAYSLVGAHAVSGAVGAALPYVAPEQTGQTGRGPDSRSDLYSLGATLYHALAGRPPFVEADGSALIRAHLAKPPVPLREVRSDVPAGVSGIIMRLLEKRPADRYAGGLGVALDLEEAARRLASTGDVAVFPTARRDPPCRPRLAARMRGRSDELAAIASALDTVRRGPAQLVSISGISGSGKSTLLDHALRAAARGGARVGRGKGEAAGHAPLHSLGTALTGLIDGLLATDDADFVGIEARLRTALGPSAARLGCLVPRLALVTGTTQGEEPDWSGEKVRNQLLLAVRRLLDNLAGARQPVVLLLDDAQWADPQCIGLIEKLLVDPEFRHVLVLLAFRTEAVTDEHPVIASLARLRQAGAIAAEITLRPLGSTHCGEMVADMLGVQAGELRELTTALRRASGGYPFTLERATLGLHDLGHLRLDVAAGAWTWDAQQVHGLGVTEDVADLLGASMGRLPPEARELLALAACLGSSFRVSWLAAASGRSVDEVHRVLRPAFRDQLVVPMLGRQDSDQGDSGPVDRYSFLHDQLQTAAIAEIPTSQRPTKRLAIGYRLEAALSARDEEARFSIVGQFNAGRAEVAAIDERIRIARLGLRAGRSAMRAAAYARAAELLEQALEWLAVEGIGWTGVPDLHHDIHRALAEACLSAGRLERSEEIVQAALVHVTSARGRMPLEILRTRRLVLQSDHAGAIQVMLRVLGQLGLALPSDVAGWQAASGAALAAVAELIGDQDLQTFLHAPANRHPRTVNEAAVLHALAPISSVVPHVFPVVAANMVRLALERGPTPHSPYGYAIFGLLEAAMGNYERAHAFGRLALDLNQRQDKPSLRPPIRHLFGAFLCHWKEPYQDALTHLVSAFDGAMDHGIFDTAGWAAMNVDTIGLARGAELPWLAELGARHIAVCRGLLRYDDAVHVVAFTQHVVASLRGDEARASELEAQGLPSAELEARLAHYAMALLPIRTVALQRDVILRDLPSARARLRVLNDPATLALAPGLTAVTEIAFYDSLVCVLSNPQSADALQRLRRNADQLRVWSASAPANHLYKQLLVEAEIAALEEDDPRALDLFERAADAAEANGILHGIALVFERTADHHARRGRTRLVLAYLRQACDEWARWGANARVRQLERQYPRLRRQPAWQMRSRAGVGDLEWSGVEDLFRAIQGLTQPSRLPDTLVRAGLDVAGAERCVLLLIRDGALCVAAEAAAGRALANRPADTPDLLADRDDLPKQPILYALRTGAEVLLSDASADQAFGADPCIVERGLRSVLCLPITGLGGPIGVLHLEHVTATRAFSKRRVGLLRTFTALATTALENARLIEEQTAVSKHLGRLADDRSREFDRLYRDHMLILDSVRDGIVWVDADGRITYANPAASRITGVPGPELLRAESTTVFRCQDSSSPLHDRAECAVCSGKLPTERATEWAFRGEDGRLTHVEWVGHALQDAAGEPLGTLLMVRDCTVRQQMAQQLRHAQKMEAIGQFAGGLAHDFNNLLTPILGYLELVAMSLGPDHEQAQPIAAAKVAAQRAADLVRQMLAFGRRTELFKRPTKLTLVVDEVLRFVRRSLDRTVTLDWVAPRSSPWVDGDSGQLGQVLLNLLVNARDAVRDRRSWTDESPVIRVTLDTVDAEDMPALGARDAPLGRLARLTVIDNGIGMTQEVVSKVFDPFFTTKTVGSGSGLGLSVAYGIVEQHGGWIRAQAGESHGAVFTVWLPQSAPPKEVALPAPAPARTPEGNGRILVVDDEAVVRSLARQQLERLGYEVVEAANGEEGLRLHREWKGQLAAIILDLSMPVMGGQEMLSTLRRSDEEIPVLLWSGYDLSGGVGSAAEMGAQAALRKPHTLGQLASALGRLLNPDAVQDDAPE